MGLMMSVAPASLSASSATTEAVKIQPHLRVLRARSFERASVPRRFPGGDVFPDESCLKAWIVREPAGCIRDDAWDPRDPCYRR
jgi:hypothetical protein